MERLSLFCHICGVFSVFIGLAMSFMDLLNGDVKRIQTDLYIFFTGYALVKISNRLSSIIASERQF
jgi:hypothetical protein